MITSLFLVFGSLRVLVYLVCVFYYNGYMCSLQDMHYGTMILHEDTTHKQCDRDNDGKTKEGGIQKKCLDEIIMFHLS